MSKSHHPPDQYENKIKFKLASVDIIKKTIVLFISSLR